MLLLALLLAGSSWSASIARVMKVKPLGGHSWEPDVFRERGGGWCEHGPFHDAGVAPGGKELRLVCTRYGDEGRPLRETQVLDADGRLLRLEPYGPEPLERIVWLGRGKGRPLPVSWDRYRARADDRELQVEHGLEGVAVVGKDEGGPLIVAGYGFGEKGLEAFRPDGTAAWSLPEPSEVRGVSVIRLDGKPRLAVWHGLARLAILDMKGKVLERVLFEGNADRLFARDGKEPRLYALDSGAGSKRETLLIMKPVKEKGGRRWESAGKADLGPLTVTAWTAGSYGPVVGTLDGWIFLLDEAGAVAASTKFRSAVRRLEASDLDGDGKDELVVVLEGASQNVVVFSPK